MLNFLEGARLIRLESEGSLNPGTDSSPHASLAVPTPWPSDGNNHRHSSSSDGALAIPIVAIVFTFIWLIVKAIMSPFHNRNRQQQPGHAGGGLTAEEVAILQKLQRTLSQMESRVEALETILIDQARTEKSYGPKL